MTRDEALHILRLNGAPSPDQVRAAYRAAAALSIQSGATHLPRAVRQARDFLVQGHVNPPCQTCRGRGKVVVGFVTSPCLMCGGTGELKHA
jgi:RecJ-like exonuclease